jgi:Rrf2 family protein
MLSKTAEYALRAVVWLAGEPGRAESAARLATVTKAPRRYLHKVLQDLVRAKIVRSQPGPGGGYALDVPPDKVSILDVINAVAPLERILQCPLGLLSHARLCPLHMELDKVYALAEQAFARVTVAKLVRSASPAVPLCEAP